MPGVIGLGAVINLIKADMAIPSGRIVIAGSGPLLYAAAWKIMRMGGNLVAIADLSSRVEWLMKLPAMISRSDLLWQGIKWIAGIKRKRIPIYYRHTVASVCGERCVRRVYLSEFPLLKKGKTKSSITIEADSLCVGHGLTPNTEITRLIGARHEYVPDMGGWIPVRDNKGQITVPNVFAIGDAAGIRGATVSEFEGEHVGLAVCEILGLGKDRNPQEKIIAHRSLKRALKFGKAGAELMRLRIGLLDFIGSDTPICRCEEVTRSEVEKAAKDNPDLNFIKKVTRCGMGPCQGRYCEEILRMLLGHNSGKPISELGYFTPRDPLFPIEIGKIVGNVEYEKIDFPTPLPG